LTNLQLPQVSLMHKILSYVAFGWLTLGSTLHFVIDVVAQQLRGKRAPGPETNLYYGLHSSYTLGQVMLGVLGLLLTHHALEPSIQWPFMVVAFAATVAWLTICFLFIEYWEPKLVVGLFAILLVAAVATARTAP
jgi:hypothetical protein